jgi:hypothetical protein
VASVAFTNAWTPLGVIDFHGSPIYLSSHTAGLSAYCVIVAFVLYKLLYKRSSYDVNEKRATKYAILTMLLIWITWEGYLQFIIPIMGMIGIFPALANSLIIGTVAFTVFITMYYGLHGKYFTTLMLEHMPWVIAPSNTKLPRAYVLAWVL